jgi:hypothetical protein
MILEEATYDAFGYYPSKLKPKSTKSILAACDKCGKIRGTPKHHYHALCRSCAHKGRILTEEHKAKIGAANKGNINCLGHILTEEHKAKVSIAMKGKNIGKNNPNWQGGLSFEPYCVKFNEEFKEYIRAKFGYTCFLCPTTQVENGRKLSVHHVNYNKDCGCDGDKTCNYVPLCMTCHNKTNFNRDWWQKFITDKLHCMIIGWCV